MIFDETVVFWQKLDKTDKIQIKNNVLSGKKLYQRLAIASHYRHHLWHIKTTKSELLLAVGRYWVVYGEPSVLFEVVE